MELYLYNAKARRFFCVPFWLRGEYMKKLYEEIYTELINLLKDTAEKSYLAYAEDRMNPLFSITNNKFNLMRNVAYFSNYQVLNVCKRMCIELCMNKNITIVETPKFKEVDFLMDYNGKWTGVIVSDKSSFMPDIDDAIEFGIEKVINVVLKDCDVPVFLKPNSGPYKLYPYKERVENITIKQFYDKIGDDSYDEFKECVSRYNYEAELTLGMTVSSIPTEKAMKVHKGKVKDALLSYFYENELSMIFTNDEVIYMKKKFESVFGIMIEVNDFSNSFISSEWYYDLQVKTDGGLDQTAIVAGYLKSVEQLLFSLLLSLCEYNDFYFYTNKAGREKTGKKRLILRNNNKELLLTMAGNLLKVIEQNKHIVMHKTILTDRVIEYLNNYIDNTRNGYMHKDNIYDMSEIEKIREKTYCVYFMILSTFKIM